MDKRIRMRRVVSSVKRTKLMSSEALCARGGWIGRRMAPHQTLIERVQRRNGSRCLRASTHGSGAAVHFAGMACTEKLRDVDVDDLFGGGEYERLGFGASRVQRRGQRPDEWQESHHRAPELEVRGLPVGHFSNDFASHFVKPKSDC